MEFKEMKVIWESQKDQPMFAFDREALHAMVRRKRLCIEQCVNIFEIVMIVILMAVAGILVGTRLFDAANYQPYTPVANVMMLVVALSSAGYVAGKRFQRRQNELMFDQSLRGDLDKAISQIDYQISRLKSFHWWFILPMALLTALNCVAQGVSFPELFEGRKIWIWPLFLASIVICYAAIVVELRWFHFPRKRNLESLREKLLDQ